MDRSRIYSAIAQSIWDHLQADYAPARHHFHTETASYCFHWSLRDYRLSDEVRNNVLTVHACHLAEHLQDKGVMTCLIALIREGDTLPRIPLRHLHFQECNTNFGRLLKRLHFHRYQIAQATDWWLPITGQKELPL